MSQKVKSAKDWVGKKGQRGLLSYKKGKKPLKGGY